MYLTWAIKYTMRCRMEEKKKTRISCGDIQIIMQQLLDEREAYACK